MTFDFYVNSLTEFFTDIVELISFWRSCSACAVSVGLLASIISLARSVRICSLPSIRSTCTVYHCFFSVSNPFFGVSEGNAL